ncbi:MAG TPA: thioredoxin [Cyclobacteriaceae bacterium]
MPHSSLKDLVGSDTLTLIDFSAEWCGPCKMQAPILQDLKAKVGDKVRIVKIDVDRNPGAANAYEVRGVPTLILFKNGQVLWRQSGVATTGQLKQLIDRNF